MPSVPPYTATELMGRKYEKPSIWRSICCASSRVGAITTQLMASVGAFSVYSLLITGSR